MKWAVSRLQKLICVSWLFLAAVVVIDVDIPSEHMSGDDHWIVEVRRNLGRGKWTAYQTIAVVAVGETSVTVSLESGNLFELAFRGNVSGKRVTQSLAT